MSSKSGGDVTIGYRYYMDLHMGLAQSVDEIIEMRAGDLKMNVPIVDDDGDYEIDSPELFGGDKKEGGIKGRFIMMNGHPWQTVYDYIKNMMGGRVPDFRGVATAYYTGLICSLNPYPKPWSFRLRRTNGGWDEGDTPWQPDLAAVWLEDGQIRAMNAAHIVFEAAVNRVWGRGLPRTLIDEASFTAAAYTLRDEEFGVCTVWDRQTTLDEFVQSVIDHVGGAVYIDRQTGLLTMKLIRGDYTAAELPLYTYNSGLLEIKETDTAARDTAVNEVIVKWTDPIRKEKDRMVRVHNLASIQSLGGAINSVTRPYPMLPTFNLASRVAQRDLKIESSAIKKYVARFDRRAWNLNPGDVIRVSAPDKGIGDVVIRIGKAKDGTLAAGAIEFDAMIDVFGLPSSRFVDEEPAGWIPPNRAPQIITTRMLREATYRDLFRTTRPADLNLIEPTSGYIYVAGVKPTPLSLSYNIQSHSSGETAFITRGTSGFVPTALLEESIDLYTTVFDISSGKSLDLVEIGDSFQIDQEIFGVADIAYDADGIPETLTVFRGCVDTLPETHAGGARLFFVDENYGTDRREYANGEVSSVRLLGVTSSAVLDPTLAPVDTLTITARQGRPYPPGNLRVNGSPYGLVSSVTGDIVLSWAHRSRLLQQDQLIGHGEASVGPEPGTTYIIRIFADPGDPTPVRTATTSDITWTYSDGMMLMDDTVSGSTIEVQASRDGILSFQKYRFTITHDLLSGYGRLYGRRYGG